MFFIQVKLTHLFLLHLPRSFVYFFYINWTQNYDLTLEHNCSTAWKLCPNIKVDLRKSIEVVLCHQIMLNHHDAYQRNAPPYHLL